MSILVFDSLMEAYDYCIHSPGQVVFSIDLSRFVACTPGSFPYRILRDSSFPFGSPEFFQQVSEFQSFLEELSNNA